MKKLYSCLTLMRVHQYVKNLFLFLPLFFAGQIGNIELLTKAFIAFIAFSFSASAIYILNDYMDIEDDRKHPTKKDRPLASGLILKKEAFLLMTFLSILGLALIINLSFETSVCLLTYIILNIAYSFYLKHIAIIDISIISIGFVIRIFVGSIATETPLSNWIVIMTFLLAMFLALAKRRDDVIFFHRTGKKMRKVIDGYNIQLVDGAMLIMSSVVIVSYLLYTTSLSVIEKFNNEYLYITSFFVIVGILRYMQISFVHNAAGSPTKVLLNDKFLIVVIISWLALFTYLIY